ncbi:hypothetical protein [Sphingobacterium sp. E70]|uniref:hypothetical protein n=1 Tax=Sphingobacterium sp. E70 TaxID=2853439 RepID=UPI002795960B|nr:hypothetical protein [Sphingobacterium sp. E70]
MINNSELILNSDGSIYHLNLLPEDLANTIITVGDPDRVAKVSKYFDRIELKRGSVSLSPTQDILVLNG